MSKNGKSFLATAKRFSSTFPATTKPRRRVVNSTPTRKHRPLINPIALKPDAAGFGLSAVLLAEGTQQSRAIMKV
jgi:hypothetical protein